MVIVAKNNVDISVITGFYRPGFYQILSILSEIYGL